SVTVAGDGANRACDVARRIAHRTGRTRRVLSGAAGFGDGSFVAAGFSGLGTVKVRSDESLRPVGPVAFSASRRYVAPACSAFPTTMITLRTRSGRVGLGNTIFAGAGRRCGTGITDCCVGTAGGNGMR